MFGSFWTYFLPVYVDSLKEAHDVLNHDKNIWVTIPLIEHHLHDFAAADGSYKPLEMLLFHAGNSPSVRSRS